MILDDNSPQSAADILFGLADAEAEGTGCAGHRDAPNSFDEGQPSTRSDLQRQESHHPFPVTPAAPVPPGLFNMHNNFGESHSVEPSRPPSDADHQAALFLEDLAFCRSLNVPREAGNIAQGESPFLQRG